MSWNQCVRVTAFMSVMWVGASIGSAAITIPTVPVGDAGNSADITGFGSVAHPYNIATYEVTAGQYTAFLNAVARTDTHNLYNTSMASISVGSGIARALSGGTYTYSVLPEFENRPVNYISFWDAARFANWLHNGQPTGSQDHTTTEDGAYSLTPEGIASNTVGRNAGAQWAIPSEDEWYKAAFSMGGGTDAGYWLYPTGSNTTPGSSLVDSAGNNANYYTGAPTYPIDSPFYTTLGGEFQNSASPYGTFDQGGNLWEWNDSILLGTDRGIRGGSFDCDETFMRATNRRRTLPTNENGDFGFRVVQIPAPSSVALLTLAGLFASRRRR
ncbi:MAG: SUMF1/EgtB/PvdO family nonheme iron enzyme [Phycisphaerales bacterium]|nr:MAG: SUMF1/EgtB/PvdO family nonheme iron enzyme [Phycisphaerales bacterium]